ncbi:MAG: hypothetical protein ACXWFQ_01000, partial [Thermoanaerobaculia bacterium]
MRFTTSSLAVLLVTAPLLAGPPTLVKAGRLLDVKAGVLLEGRGILIEDGKIKEVAPLTSLSARVPKDAIVIDLSARTVLPGLIDGHAHLLDAMNYRLRGW